MGQRLLLIGTILPDDIRRRPKQMFRVPLADWLRRPDARPMTQLILTPAGDRHELFDSAYITQLMTEHIAGARDHTRKIRALVVLELWFRLFIDDFKATASDVEVPRQTYPAAARRKPKKMPVRSLPAAQ